MSAAALVGVLYGSVYTCAIFGLIATYPHHDGSWRLAVSGVALMTLPILALFARVLWSDYEAA